MRHVNVIRNWRVVELGHLLRVAVCQMLVGYSHVFVCVCVCVWLHNCMHSFLLSCTYCAGLSVHGCTFLNYIYPHYQITFSARDLAFLLACQLVVTACTSRESERATCYTIILNLIFKAAQSAAVFVEVLA